MGVDDYFPVEVEVDRIGKINDRYIYADIFIKSYFHKLLSDFDYEIIRGSCVDYGSDQLIVFKGGIRGMD